MRSQAPVLRSLAAMHRAGIPWDRALESAAGDDPKFDEARRALKRGLPLAEAMEGVLDPLDAALIAAGEKSGGLERVLGEIADAHDEARQERTEAWTGMLYPVAVAHLGAILLPLPDLMRGDVGRALLWAALILLPTWTFIGWYRRQTRRETRPPDRGDPGDPPSAQGLWRNRVESADARALDVLGRLYDAGVPIADALDLAMAAGWGGRAACDLAEARRRVGRGQDLAGSWRHLPPDLASRLRTSEESGSLGEALLRVAAELRFGVRTRRKRLAVLLPVLVMLTIGAIVALRVLTFWGELYEGLGRY